MWTELASKRSEVSHVWKKIWQYKKWLVIMVVLVLGIKASMSYYGQRHKPPAFMGNTITVERGDIRAVVSATGTISAVNSVDISARITGLIKEVRVNENDKVKAGRILVILDDTTLQTQVAQARAQLSNAAVNYERSKTLSEAGGISRQQLDADYTAYIVAQAAYDNDVSQLAYTIIRAPIDGMVIGKPIPAGQTVTPGISNPMVLLTVADLSKMQIQAQVDETDIGNIKLGQRVEFTVDAYPGKIFTGSVSLISEKSNIQQNVVYYTVYINIDSPQGLLFPSMTSRVTITTSESKYVLVIPLSTVKENKGQKYVQVITDGKPNNIPVQLGLAEEERVEILSGLNEGDQIVLPTAKPQGPAGQFGGSNSHNSLRGMLH